MCSRSVPTSDGTSTAVVVSTKITGSPVIGRADELSASHS